MNSQKLAQEPLNWLTFPVLHSCKSEEVRHGHVHYALMNIPRTKSINTRIRNAVLPR